MQRFFKDWFGWVSRIRLKPVVEVAQMLKRHGDNPLTYLKHHIANTKHAVRVRGGNNSFEPRWWLERRATGGVLCFQRKTCCVATSCDYRRVPGFRNLLD